MLSTETCVSGRALKRLNFAPVAILMLLAIAAGAPSAAGQDSPTRSIPPGLRTIIVDGNGEARARPDTVSIDVAIVTRAAKAGECTKLNAALADKVSGVLKSKLGGKGKFETSGFTLFPEFNQVTPGRKPQIIGYRAENSIAVETGETSLAGPLIDAAIGAGANRISSVNFILKDTAKPRGEAIASASRDAQAQASALAASLGVKLKRIYSATTTADTEGGVAYATSALVSARSAEVENPPTPVQPSEVTVPAHVSLVYEIE
jgi:uncharacterized protein YggE